MGSLSKESMHWRKLPDYIFDSTENERVYTVPATIQHAMLSFFIFHFLTQNNILCFEMATKEVRE
jgi:hypothetical protein